MKLRLLPAMFAVLALTAAAVAQDPGTAPPPGQNSNQNSGQGNGGGYGQGGGRGGMMGRGLMGTVTEVTADHYTIKTEMGDVYTVHFSANTRITKQPAGMRGPGGGGGGQGTGRGSGYGRGPGGNGGGNPPVEIKATDIKVGDSIVAMGDIDKLVLAHVEFVLACKGQHVMKTGDPQGDSLYYPVLTGVKALTVLPSLGSVKTQTINPYVWGPLEPAINTWFDQNIVQ